MEVDVKPFCINQKSTCVIYRLAKEMFLSTVTYNLPIYTRLTGNMSGSMSISDLDCQVKTLLLRWFVDSWKNEPWDKLQTAKEPVNCNSFNFLMEKTACDLPCCHLRRVDFGNLLQVQRWAELIHWIVSKKQKLPYVSILKSRSEQSTQPTLTGYNTANITAVQHHSTKVIFTLLYLQHSSTKTSRRWQLKNCIEEDESLGVQDQPMYDERKMGTTFLPEKEK